MSNAVLFLRAQTSLHPGAGTSIGAIDLPIQRERHTTWPTIQGSSIKGVLRDVYRLHLVASGTCTTREEADNNDELKTIFGPPGGETEFAGALGVTDARILAFPVRSAKGVFVWVTCPGVIGRAIRDLTMAVLPVPWGQINVDNGDALTHSTATGIWIQVQNTSHLILEDLSFQKSSEPVTEVEKFTKWVAGYACGLDVTQHPAGSGLGDPRTRLAVISDDAFRHLVVHATELVTRIKLDYKAKKVEGSLLFTQELLPPETIFYVLFLPEKPHNQSSTLTQQNIIRKVTVSIRGNLLQIGGNETTGKGWCWARVWNPSPATTGGSTP